MGAQSPAHLSTRTLCREHPAAAGLGAADFANVSAELRHIADALLDPVNGDEAKQKAARRLIQLSCSLAGDMVPAERRRAFASLSPREHEIFAALAEGRTVRDIAVRLHRSPKTVNNHRTHLMQKLKLRTTAELARLAIRLGVVSP